MTDLIVSYFTGMNQYLALFLLSMIPVTELRGAIIIAAANGALWYKALWICVLGNIIPIPFIILFLRPILNYLKKTKYFSKFAVWIQERSMKKADKIIKYEVLGLFLFVAVPLPGTGAWTGSVIAALLNMRLKKAFPTIALGVIAAGIIMVLASYGTAGILTNLFF